MTKNLVAYAALTMMGALGTSDRADGLDCAGPRSTALTLALDTLEPIAGSGDAAAERARIGADASFDVREGSFYDADGGVAPGFHATFRNGAFSLVFQAAR